MSSGFDKKSVISVQELSECPKCGREKVDPATAQCADCHYSESESYASPQDAREVTHGG
jgi:ribosomal protein L37E